MDNLSLVSACIQKKRIIMKLLLATCLQFTISITGSGKARANLVINGDFETGNLSGWNNSGTVVVGSELDFHTGGGGEGSFPVGSYAVNFGGYNLPNDGIISQSLETIIGQEYSLTFDYGRFQYGDGGPQSLHVEVISLTDNNHLIDTIITDSSGERNLSLLFEEYSYQFISSSSSVLLSFGDVSSGTHDTDGVLDNVSITVIPTPGALILGSIGIGFVTWLRRRRTL